MFGSGPEGVWNANVYCDSARDGDAVKRLGCRLEVAADNLVRDTNPEESFGEATLVGDAAVELSRSLKLRQLAAVSLSAFRSSEEPCVCEASVSHREVRLKGAQDLF